MITSHTPGQHFMSGSWYIQLIRTNYRLDFPPSTGTNLHHNYTASTMCTRPLSRSVPQPMCLFLVAPVLPPTTPTPIFPLYCSAACYVSFSASFFCSPSPRLRIAPVARSSCPLRSLCSLPLPLPLPRRQCCCTTETSCLILARSTAGLNMHEMTSLTVQRAC